jgi:hypothetical protein
MKTSVASLPSDRRLDRVRALQGAVTRFQIWQRSLQQSAIVPARRRPHQPASARPRGR